MYILKATTHSAFSFVHTKYNNDDRDMTSFGLLRGLIQINDIILMMYMKVFVNWKEVPEDGQIVVTKSVPSRKTTAQKVETFYRNSMGFDLLNIRGTLLGHGESLDKLNELFPRYPTVEDLDISLEDQDLYFLNVSLAMDAAPSRVSSGIGYPHVIKFNTGTLFLVLSKKNND